MLWVFVCFIAALVGVAAGKAPGYFVSGWTRKNTLLWALMGATVPALVPVEAIILPYTGLPVCILILLTMMHGVARWWCGRQWLERPWLWATLGRLGTLTALRLAGWIAILPEIHVVSGVF